MDTVITLPTQVEAQDAADKLGIDVHTLGTYLANACADRLEHAARRVRDAKSLELAIDEVPEIAEEAKQLVDAAYACEQAYRNGLAL